MDSYVSLVHHTTDIPNPVHAKYLTGLMSGFKMNFNTRPFNSAVFEEDCEYISKLPAFQVYIRGEYANTVYDLESLKRYLEKVSNPPSKPRKRWFSFWRSKTDLIK